MRLTWMAVLLVLLLGCATHHGTGGSGPTPATKKELPWLDVFGGRMRTTLFYGPWQCRQEFMNDCRRQCSRERLPLRGCIWLADIKLEWEGRLVIPPFPVKAGSRYGIYHCCCQYPELSAAENAARRKEWDRFRETYREDWSKQFGKWPTDEGVSWPGHHIWDLKHGGGATDRSNLIPVHPDVHGVFNEQYPACYDGKAPWNTVGPNLPYVDH